MMPDIQVCTGCKKELPFTYQFFPPDKQTKYGLRVKCRCCNPKYGKYLEDDKPKKRQLWTKEEDELLKQNYANFTNEELRQKFFIHRTIRAIETHAGVLGCSGKSEETLKRINSERAKITSVKNKGRTLSDEAKEKISRSKKEYYKTHDNWNKGKKMSKESREKMSKAKKAVNKWIGEDNPRHKHPLRGKENGRWKGGYKPLIKSMRDEIKEWKKLIAGNCNYSCVFTQGEFSDIHHVIPFRQLFDMALHDLNLEEKSCQALYEPSEYEKLRIRIVELHDVYGIGLCLNKEIHKLFHDTYGYTDNTPEHFFEFVSRCENGEFDNFFEENGLKLNFNMDAIFYCKKQYLLLKEGAA